MISSKKLILSARLLKKVFLQISMEKRCEFELDREIVEKGGEYIDGILSDIGRHVTSLTMKCACKFSKNYPCSRVMDWIDSKSLTSLRIDDICKECQNDMLLHNFVKVEILTLKVSFEQLKKNFFKSFLQKFHKLKSLNILFAKFEWGELEAVFKNNPDIERLVLRRVDGIFDCKLLELIPKVKILVLDTFDWYLRNIDALQSLHQITKLRVDCERENLNNLVGELAQKGSVEEMELVHIKVDDKFFDILKTFDHLQLLSINFCDDVDDGDDDEYDPKNWKLNTAFTSLSRLKYLR